MQINVFTPEKNVFVQDKREGGGGRFFKGEGGGGGRGRIGGEKQIVKQIKLGEKKE